MKTLKQPKLKKPKPPQREAKANQPKKLTALPQRATRKKTLTTKTGTPNSGYSVNRMTLEQFLGTKGPSFAKPSKLRNIRTEYDGRTYDSRKEASFAAGLDQAKLASHPAERVKEWIPQVRFELAVNGILICKYVLDFKVTYADGTTRYVDVKGRKDGVPYNLFTLKKRLMLAVHNITIEEV